jgi:hypothetical protein
MDFVVKDHRFAQSVVEVVAPAEWHELQRIIASITDDDIVFAHQQNPPPVKSLSKAINRLIRERLVGAGWTAEPAIFKNVGKGRAYQDGYWRLDFAKGNMLSVEVAFNHLEAAAWNLLKPCLASELNHVEKEQTTLIGVIVTATEALKQSGGFDSAVGTFEKYVSFLMPLRDLLPPPLLIVGLQPMKKYRLDVRPHGGGRLHGHVVAI